MNASRRNALAAVALLAMAQSAAADVIGDWNEKAVAFIVSHNIPPPPGERVMAMTQLAMFDAVNSIERKYQPYLLQLPAAPTASKEAAAAAAAGTVLAGINPQAQAEMKAALATYLTAIPDGPAKDEGVRLGEAIGAKMLEARANDGATAPDVYRPRTTPGVYVPTVLPLASHWPGVKPFVLTSASQFRPEPPVALSSAEWAASYNEIKELGSRTSTQRSARQTEDARFWLAVDGRVYYPIIRLLAADKELSVVDCARLFALVAAARADGLIAVFDAKYHYEFWRPVTAIRNGDMDGNPATERDAAWQPFDFTPMHPEYPCAHCIESAALAGVVLAVFGTADMEKISNTSPTAPGVIHSWTNIRAFVDEVSEARIWAGFHYRFSTKVGRDMGYKIGDYVAKTILQPVNVAKR
ncbi:MAG TPA: vanadium-dependent haloperoxidase [Xanthobacteraceae bacterium]|nr:vanadium-dependent haloperoxidase [Xanthobacteraceae bacterium]